MKIDIDLLKRLLTIDHPNKREWPMLTAIINECYKIDNITFEIDGYSNLIITRNTNNPLYYPLVVAHTDCVLEHENKSLKEVKGKIYGVDALSRKQIGLGADDTCGIVCAIQLLREIPDLKVIFTTEEECGFNGAEYVTENLSFFLDVSYMIQADRHGANDLIVYTNCIHSVSEEWLNEITPLMAEFKYSEEYGLGTDIGVMADILEISGVNISCGYYREHTEFEYIILDQLQNCLNFMEAIIKTVPLTKQYTINPDQYRFYGSYGRYGSYLNNNIANTNQKRSLTDPYYVPRDYPYDEDDDPCSHCTTYNCSSCEHLPYWWIEQNDKENASENESNVEEEQALLPAQDSVKQDLQ